MGVLMKSGHWLAGRNNRNLALEQFFLDETTVEMAEGEQLVLRNESLHARDAYFERVQKRCYSHSYEQEVVDGHSPVWWRAFSVFR